MPFPVAAAIAAGGALVGQGIQSQGAKLNNTKNFKRTKQLMDKQQAMNQQMALFNNEQQMKMWEATGPGGQMEQLRKAGLNPGLIYGMGGAGGQTAQAAQGQGVSAPSFHGENPAAGAGQTGALVGEQLALMRAQKENIEADTANKTAGATDTLGSAANRPIQGKNIEADTANKKAANAGIEAASNEAKDLYELIKKPNRSIEAKTWEDELSARQGAAETIYELWHEGKLKEKGLAEVEQTILQNAKTYSETRNIQKAFDLIEQHIKGEKLENIMREIDAENAKIGIGKNATTPERILGRLYNMLTGQR